MGDRHYWETNHECLFIDGIGKGKWSKSLRCRNAGRETLLRRYKQALLYRIKWNKINPGKVMAHLDKALMEYHR